MGACSSKPKTKESDGPVEPHKPTDFAAGQPQHAERSLDSAVDDHEKKDLVKLEEEREAAQSSTGPLQLESGLDPSKDEQQPKKLVLSSSTQGHSALPSGEEKPVCKAGTDEVHQKESWFQGSSNQAVRPVDNDSAAVTDNGTENRSVEASANDKLNTCEDKAVVSEKACEDGTCVDKAVTLDEEKSSPETSGVNRNVVVPEGKSIDYEKCAGVESPISGVVHPVKPMDEAVDTGGTAKIVADDVDKDSSREDTHIDSAAVVESADAGARNAEGGVYESEDLKNVGGGVNKTEDLKRDSLEREEDFPAKGLQIPHPASSVEPTVETIYLVGEADPSENIHEKAGSSKDSQGERASQSQGASPSNLLGNVSLENLASDGKAAEGLADPKLDPQCEERVINHRDCSHFNKPRDDDVVMDKLIGEAFIANKNANSDSSKTKSPTKDLPRESFDGKKELATEEVDVNNGQTQVSRDNGDCRSTAMLGEKTHGEIQKDEQIPASRTEGEKQVFEKTPIEPTSSADLAFEDASDRLESSKSMDAEQLAI